MVTAHALHKRATRVLPEVIQTSGVLLPDDGECGIAALLFPLRRKSSGSLVFRLSAQSAVELSGNPVAYLKHATRAREGMGKHAKPCSYRSWRKVLIPMSWRDGEQQKSCEAHAPSIGVYFTTKTDGKAWLVLIPEDRILLYVWHD